jgi:ABC-2 type transport system permease protein
LSWRADVLAVWAVIVRNGLMASRNVFFFFELLFWPIVGVVSIGLMTKFLGLTAAQGSFVLIGTIALSVVNVCQLEVAYAVLMDVWSKSLKHQFLAPIGIRHLTIGSWVVGMVRGGAIFALLALLAWWAFGFRVLEPGAAAAAIFVLGCFLTAWIVGVLVCALITLFGNRAEAAAWSSVNLVLVLAGIYYPVSVLPEPAAAIARAIPLTYFLDAFRAHFGFAAEFAAPITTGLTLSIAYVLIAHLAFYASVQRARRTGLLLKMSE